MILPHCIFLPGASSDPLFWQPVAAALPIIKDNFTLQYYPGFAGIPNVENLTNFSQLNHWIIQQITHPSIIVAQSMGGILAVQAALKKPELVKAIILCATSGGIDLSHFDVEDWRQDYQLRFASQPDWFLHTQIDLSPELENIRVPVLLLWGDADPISPVAIGEYLKQQLAHAELSIIANGQHDFAKVHAKQVAAHILDFLHQHF